MNKIERRMDGYYYGFTTTGVDVVDKVLGAVACAGKAYHHTEDWGENTGPYDDHTGATPVDWIQNAARESADEIERLRKALQVSMKVMARSHNRIHALPRVTDTELADDIDRAIGTARAALSDSPAALAKEPQG